jgi:hypothetical protein
MFRASSCPSSGATTTAVAASGLPSELGDSSAVGRGWAGWSDGDQHHCYHHVTTLKPEAATAVVVAPDDGHGDARNKFKRKVMNLRSGCTFSLIQLKIWRCTDWQTLNLVIEFCRRTSLLTL